MQCSIFNLKLCPTLQLVSSDIVREVAGGTLQPLIYGIMAGKSLKFPNFLKICTPWFESLITLLLISINSFTLLVWYPKQRPSNSSIFFMESENSRFLAEFVPYLRKFKIFFLSTFTLLFNVGGNLYLILNVYSLRRAFTIWSSTSINYFTFNIVCFTTYTQCTLVTTCFVLYCLCSCFSLLLSFFLSLFSLIVPEMHAATFL